MSCRPRGHPRRARRSTHRASRTGAAPSPDRRRRAWRSSSRPPPPRSRRRSPRGSSCARAWTASGSPSTRGPRRASLGSIPRCSARTRWPRRSRAPDGWRRKTRIRVCPRRREKAAEARARPPRSSRRGKLPCASGTTRARTTRSPRRGPRTTPPYGKTLASAAPPKRTPTPPPRFRPRTPTRARWRRRSRRSCSRCSGTTRHTIPVVIDTSLCSLFLLALLLARTSWTRTFVASWTSWPRATPRAGVC